MFCRSAARTQAEFRSFCEAAASGNSSIGLHVSPKVRLKLRKNSSCFIQPSGNVAGGSKELDWKLNVAAGSKKPRYIISGFHNSKENYKKLQYLII